MSRIAARFASLKQAGRGALVTYLQAYDPDPATSLAILRGLPAAGADIIEVGIPFTDPMADGPAIQRAAQRALKAGATLPGVLALVRDFRRQDDATPIVLMGYYNPILSYGVDRFCVDAASSGVDGLIVVDVPSEEADEIEPQARANGLDLIRLVAPTTDDERLPRVLKSTTGFVYYVSITGITGTRSAAKEVLEAAIPRIRRHTGLPIPASCIPSQLVAMRLRRQPREQVLRITRSGIGVSGGVAGKMVLERQVPSLRRLPRATAPAQGHPGDRGRSRCAPGVALAGQRRRSCAVPGGCDLRGWSVR